MFDHFRILTGLAKIITLDSLTKEAWPMSKSLSACLMKGNARIMRKMQVGVGAMCMLNEVRRGGGKDHDSSNLLSCSPLAKLLRQCTV